MEWICGQKVMLRPMTREDTVLIVAWRNNPRVRHNFIYQELFTTEGHLHWFDTVIDTGKAIQFIICEKDTERPIGSVYFRDIDEQKKQAEYGIFIGADDAVGKGIGSEVCQLACRYGFQVRQWRKIILRVYADNLAALRTYEKAGFQKTSMLRDKTDENGLNRDMILMELWASRKE